MCALCVLSLRCLQPKKRLVNQNSSKLCTSTALFKVEATRDPCQQIRRSCFGTTKYTDTLVMLVQSNVVPVSRWLVRLQSIFPLFHFLFTCSTCSFIITLDGFFPLGCFGWYRTRGRVRVSTTFRTFRDICCRQYVHLDNNNTHKRNGNHFFLFLSVHN